MPKTPASLRSAGVGGGPDFSVYSTSFEFWFDFLRLGTSCCSKSEFAGEEFGGKEKISDVNLKTGGENPALRRRFLGVLRKFLGVFISQVTPSAEN